MLEVAVGEISRRVVGTDHATLDLRWEGLSPQDWGFALAEDDPSHARLGGVDGLDHGGVHGQELGDLGGSVAQILR